MVLRFPIVSHSAGRTSNTRTSTSPPERERSPAVRLLHQYRVTLVNITPQEPAQQIHFVDALKAWLRSVEDLRECH